MRFILRNGLLQQILEAQLVRGKAGDLVLRQGTLSVRAQLNGLQGDDGAAEVFRAMVADTIEAAPVIRGPQVVEVHPKGNIRQAQIQVRAQYPLSQQLQHLVILTARPDVVGLVGVQDQAEVGEIFPQHLGSEFVGLPAVRRDKLLRHVAAAVYVSAAVVADIFVGPGEGELDLRVLPGELPNDRPGGGPGGVEGNGVGFPGEIVGVPLGAPVTVAPFVPGGAAELLDVPAGSPAQLPGLLVDVCPHFEEGLLAFLGDGEEFHILALAQLVDLQEGVVELNAIRGAAAGLDVQLLRHGEDLVEVDGAVTVFLVFDDLQHPADGFRVASEADTVGYMIWHNSSFPTPTASISLIFLPKAEMTGTLTALPAILYSRPSEKPRAATLLNCSSVKPCSLQHSLGVSFRMTP